MPEKLNGKMFGIATRVYIWFIFVLLFPESFAEDAFQGCSVIGFPPLSNEAELEELQRIPHLDFFIGPSMNGSSEVLACEEAKDKLLQALAKYKIPPKTLLDDASKMELGKPHFGNIAVGKMDWNDYYSMEQIYAWLDAIVKENSRYVSMTVIGTTHEKREIRSYSIQAYETKDPPPPDPSIGGPYTNYRFSAVPYIQCLSEAREWTTVPVCTYIMNELIQNRDSYIESLGPGWRFCIVPVANPDGYAYTNEAGKHTWRKNRRPISGNEQVTCKGNYGEENIGVDLGRNWPFHWQESSDPCSHTYSGVKNQVEQEVKAVKEFLVSSPFDSLETGVFIDIRCCSEAIMFPWGYTKDRIPNFEEINRFAEKYAPSDGKKFTVGQVSHLRGPMIARMLYFDGLSYGIPVDGIADIGARFYASYVVDIRPASSLSNSTTYMYPFRLSPSKILPAVKEVWKAVLGIRNAVHTGQTRSNFEVQPKACTILLSTMLAISFINLF